MFRYLLLLLLISSTILAQENAGNRKLGAARRTCSNVDHCRTGERCRKGVCRGNRPTKRPQSGSAQVSLSCPGSNHFAVLVGGTNLQCSSPGAVSTCPTNAICLQAVGSSQLICCRIIGYSPICPNSELLQPSVSGFEDCSSNPGVCSDGYQCVPPLDNKNMRVCCSQTTRSNAAVCPNDAQPLTDAAGNPRLCAANWPYSCPYGYSCQSALVPTGSSLCCETVSYNPPICPNNKQLQPSASGFVDCSHNSEVCAYGYNCVTALNSNQRVCCSICPNGAQPSGDSMGTIYC